jgi:hypothetical protein
VIAAICVSVACAARVKITLNVLSGGEDPSWVLEGEVASRMISNLPTDIYTRDASPRPLPWYRLGYRGFEVEVYEDDMARVFTVYNDVNVERVLLASAPLDISPAIIKHTYLETIRVANMTAEEKLVDAFPPLDMMPPTEPNAPCDLPVRGPDNGTIYDPQNENCGFFTRYCSQNNCYNYGNDIVTNTFAQPGRGSGEKWHQNTCDDIRASATRDGLVWQGTTLPTANPDKGHFVALLIWPGTNFHWIRFDSQPHGFWSHKPGGTPVRNVDNNNRKITDPSKQDFSPWSQFCGYMTTLPSTARIN